MLRPPKLELFSLLSAQSAPTRTLIYHSLTVNTNEGGHTSHMNLPLVKGFRIYRDPALIGTMSNPHQDLLRLLQQRQQVLQATAPPPPSYSSLLGSHLQHPLVAPLGMLGGAVQPIALSEPRWTHDNATTLEQLMLQSTASLLWRQQQALLQHRQPQTAAAPVTRKAPSPSSLRQQLASVSSKNNERQPFLIFVKVVFRYLKRMNASSTLLARVKSVVAECTLRNRQGDVDYTPLQPAVERRLRQSLGEIHWARAELCYENYRRKQAAAVAPVTPSRAKSGFAVPTTQVQLA